MGKEKNRNFMADKILEDREMVKYKGEKNTKKSNKKKDTKEPVMGD